MRPFQIWTRSAASLAVRISKAPFFLHSAVTASNWASTSAAGPSSSTISTASAPSGYSQATAASAASIESASIISMAAGSTPSAMIAETAEPPASIDSNAASTVVTFCGVRISRTVISVAMPRVPSEPMNAPSRSYPGGSAALPPSRTVSPSGVTITRPSTWLTVKPYFRQCAPPEFSAIFPPTEHTCWLEGSGA